MGLSWIILGTWVGVLVVWKLKRYAAWRGILRS